MSADRLVAILVTILTVAALFFGCVYLNKMGFKQDNILEELAEDLVEENLGLDIDLSPGSPE